MIVSGGEGRRGEDCPGRGSSELFEGDDNVPHLSRGFSGPGVHTKLSNGSLTTCEFPPKVSLKKKSEL